MNPAIKFFFVMLLVCLSVSAQAHQPRMVTGNQTPVEAPEVSQAYYAELKGQPQTYTIHAKEKFHLYVQLTVPDVEGARRDFAVTVSVGKKVIAKLDGAKAEWKKFYEPFGGDNYLLGPDFDRVDSDAGDYTIAVSNRKNSGKYVLVFGTKEVFSLEDMKRAAQMMPKVKEFMKPAPKPNEKPRQPAK